MRPPRPTRSASPQPKLMALAVALAASNSALALEFETEGGWAGSLNTTIGISSSWRAQAPDKALINAEDALANGKFTPSGAAPVCSGDAASNPALCTGKLYAGVTTTTAFGQIAAAFNANPAIPAALKPFTAAKVGAAYSGAAPLPVPALQATLVGAVNATIAPFVGSAMQQARAAGFAGGAKNDGANNNYDKGDRYSTQAKVLTELALKKGDTGALVRVKGWYDEALNNREVPWGNQANGFARNKPLSDDGLELLNRFQGIALLDAYAYTSVEVGNNPLQLRLGRQAINWGESVFIQGVNQISPVDVAALRKAGTEIKEALLPVWSLYGNLGLDNGVSVEGFYQLKWEPSNVDHCGTYWGVTEFSFGSDVGRCGMANGNFRSNRSSYNSGVYIASVDHPDPKDGGQWGLAVRFPVEAIDTEFGLYALNIHARVPNLSGNIGGDLRQFAVTASGGLVPDKATAAALGLTMTPFNNVGNLFAGTPFAALGTAVNSAIAKGTLKATESFWEYPEDVRIYALSATTNLAGWSVGAEMSYSPNSPIQRNGNDVLAGVLAGVGPSGTAAAGGSGETATGAGNTLKPVSGYFSGWDRTKKKQIQFNALNSMSRQITDFVGADSGLFVAEVAAQKLDIKNSNGSNIRYGRAFIFGNGAHVSFGNTDATNCGGALAAQAANPNPTGCKNDGYVTDFSWGYRLRASLDFNNVFGSSWQATPSVFFLHDVKGISSDSQFNEGRKTVSLGLRMSLNKVHNLDLNFTTYSDGAKYDAFRDRDNYSVAYSYTF